MTHWIQPSEALAEQLDVPPVPLPVSEPTAAAIDAGVVDLSAIARDVGLFVSSAEPDDPKVPTLRRLAAGVALTAANERTGSGDHAGAAHLLRLAARHAPEDTGIRAAYGSALWMAGRRFDGLAQLTEAVRLNSERGRMVPMLWILTARAMADSGRHGDALLLLEDLAVTGPTDFRFWELMDAIDGRSIGTPGGCRPHDVGPVLERLNDSTVAAAATPGDVLAAVSKLGTAAPNPLDPPPLCLELLASTVVDAQGSPRPGTLGMLDASVGVARSVNPRPAPIPARSCVAVEFTFEGTSASTLFGVDDSVGADAALELLAGAIAAFPPDLQAERGAFDHDLDPEPSLVLASLLDVIGSALGSGVPASAFPESAVIERAADAPAGSLRARIRSLLGVEPSADAMTAGLQQLGQLGFVRLEGETVHPIEYFNYLIRGFGVGLGWRRLTHHDTHARSLSRRHFIATGAGILRLGPNGGGGVSWSIRPRRDLLHELGLELAMISYAADGGSIPSR